MKIESRVNFKFPHIDDDGELKYSESDLSQKQRDAYRRGAEEQREEDKRVIAIAAMTVYEILSAERAGITKQVFVDSFVKAIFDDNA